MTEPEFREWVNREFARLLSYWRVIERGIKRAEQIDGNAVIPAINELRYASRQLFMAVTIMGNPALNDGQRSSVNKRLIIAEQYLMNADHDTLDAAVTFFSGEIKRLNKDLGKSKIAEHYHNYPAFCDRIVECEQLIEETRNDYDKRKPNYDKIRSDYLEQMVAGGREIENAEVEATIARANLERQVTIRRGTLRVVDILAVVGAIASVIGIPLAIWLAKEWGFKVSWFFDFRVTPPN